MLTNRLLSWFVPFQTPVERYHSPREIAKRRLSIVKVDTQRETLAALSRELIAAQALQSNFAFLIAEFGWDISHALVESVQVGISKIERDKKIVLNEIRALQRANK